MTAKEAKIIANWDFNSPECLEIFLKEAKEFTARATKSPATARQVLIKEGIITRSGKLTKNYR